PAPRNPGGRVSQPIFKLRIDSTCAPHAFGKNSHNFVPRGAAMLRHPLFAHGGIGSDEQALAERIDLGFGSRSDGHSEPLRLEVLLQPSQAPAANESDGTCRQTEFPGNMFV